MRKLIEADSRDSAGFRPWTRCIDGAGREEMELIRELQHATTELSVVASSLDKPI